MAKLTESVMHQHRIERITSDATDDDADIASTCHSRRQCCCNSSESIFIESNIRQSSKQYQQKNHHHQQQHHQQHHNHQTSYLYGLKPKNVLNKLTRITTSTSSLPNVMNNIKHGRDYFYKNEHRIHNKSITTSHKNLFSSRKCIFSRFFIVLTLILVFLIEKITCDQGK